jgi:hypothetical protein
MIVATRRPAGESKWKKDLRQANQIALALLETKRQDDLIEAFQEAEKRGPHWKAALETARRRMTQLGLVSVEACLEAN